MDFLFVCLPYNNNNRVKNDRKKISTLFILQIRKIHINIFCIYYFYIFCWILSTQLETRKIDFHKTCEKNLPKVNFWSYKFGCRTFFTRIVRFALHKYLANWCVPFTRLFLLKLVLERSFLGHFVIYHRVTMIDVSCVPFFPKSIFWQLSAWGSKWSGRPRV